MAEYAIEVLSDKWTLKIIQVCNEGISRFNDIQQRTVLLRSVYLPKMSGRVTMNSLPKAEVRQ